MDQNNVHHHHEHESHLHKQQHHHDHDKVEILDNELDKGELFKLKSVQ
jgi:hypothetical protein